MNAGAAQRGLVLLGAIHCRNRGCVACSLSFTERSMLSAAQPSHKLLSTQIFNCFRLQQQSLRTSKPLQHELSPVSRAQSFHTLNREQFLKNQVFFIDALSIPVALLLISTSLALNPICKHDLITQCSGTPFEPALM